MTDSTRTLSRRPVSNTAHRLVRIVGALALTAALASCVTVPQAPAPAPEGTPARVDATHAEQLYTQGQLGDAAREFEQLAHDTRGALSEHYRLRAAEAWRDNGDLDAAARVLSDLRRRRLQADEVPRFDLLAAEIAIHRNALDQAQALLTDIGDDAPHSLRVRAQELQARIDLARGDAFASAHARARLDRDLQGSDRDHNRAELLAALGAIDASALRERVDTLAGDDPLRPWIEQTLRKQGQVLPRSLPQPSRQVGTLAPGEGGGLQPEGYRPARRVALLLPQSAQFAGVAQSIRDGFMTAYFADPSPQRPELRIYDSGKSPQEAIAAYRKAVADGAEQVVGPLLREAVGALFHETLDARVLALNHPDTGEVPPPGSAEYGLLPEAEGAQTAEHMRQRGIVRAAIFSTNADWSERASRAFKAQFEAAGGQVVGQAQLADKEINYAKAIAQASASLGQGAEAGVFMSVRPQQARLLVPQLRVARIDAGLFASSHVYAGDNNPALDRDLDGVEFCDAPWLFGTIAGRPERAAVAAKIDSANGAGGRLFAFGMDAYALLPYLDWLMSHPDAYLNGATGQLTADHFGRIHRLVGWARFSNGIATPLVGALDAAAPTDPAPVQ